MSKKLGELWKEASSEDKDKYKVSYAYMHIRARPAFAPEMCGGHCLSVYCIH